jgi:hypothetical protein
VIYLAAVALLIVAALTYRHFRDRMPSGWTAITDGDDYGTKVEPDGSFDFPVAPNSVHYVTRACGDLSKAKGLRLRYRLEADPGVRFLLMQDGKPAPGTGGEDPVLYFQRKGDDWSGAGKFESYRWWATFNGINALAPGEFEIFAMFNERWTAVERSNAFDDPEDFKDALENADRVGFTFPGVTGFGHGCCATGKARFTLIGFEVIYAD